MSNIVFESEFGELFISILDSLRICQFVNLLNLSIWPEAEMKFHSFCLNYKVLTLSRQLTKGSH